MDNERPKGEWLEGDFYCDTYEGFESWGNFKVCSECGEESKKTTNYCSNCGAKMKEADNELLQSLCETCKKYDDCSDSTKISPNFYLLKCRKYEEADNEQRFN